MLPASLRNLHLNSFNLSQRNFERKLRCLFLFFIDILKKVMYNVKWSDFETLIFMKGHGSLIFTVLYYEEN